MSQPFLRAVRLGPSFEECEWLLLDEEKFLLTYDEEEELLLPVADAARALAIGRAAGRNVWGLEGFWLSCEIRVDLATVTVLDDSGTVESNHDAARAILREWPRDPDFFVSFTLEFGDEVDLAG